MLGTPPGTTRKAARRYYTKGGAQVLHERRRTGTTRKAARRYYTKGGAQVLHERRRAGTTRKAARRYYTKGGAQVLHERRRAGTTRKAARRCYTKGGAQVLHERWQQFLGCTNFLQYYLQPQYAHCGKVLGEFPPERLGLGRGETQGDLAVRAIKLMARRTIELSVIDEVAAVKGFHVLCTHSKGLTPPQQAWAPLSLETYAQLEVSRAVKGMPGSQQPQQTSE